MPRLGFTIQLNARNSSVEWYGRGPHETYWDRKTSGEIGIWSGTVWEQIHQYPRPQETGNKTDVRWFKVRDNQGEGLEVRAVDKLLSVSAWPFPVSDLDFEPGKKGAASASGLVPITSKHGAYLQPRNYLIWNIDYEQMGVGGDNSWGRLVHDAYTLPVKDYRWSFLIRTFEE